MNQIHQLLRQNRVTASVLAVICLLVAFSLWNVLGPRRDARLEEIRRHGYPVTLAELQDWYKPVPDSEKTSFGNVCHEPCPKVVAPANCDPNLVAQTTAATDAGRLWFCPTAYCGAMAKPSVNACAYLREKFAAK